jgi:hypothetical protein
MSAEIIQFTKDRLMPISVVKQPPLSDSQPALTARQERERRHDAWREASARTEYWRALADFRDAISSARRHNLPETYSQADDPGGLLRITLVDEWRKAISQLPAPTAAVFLWKRAAAKDPCLKVSRQQVEQVIADDVAWLKANQRRGPSPSLRHYRELALRSQCPAAPFRPA